MKYQCNMVSVCRKQRGCIAAGVNPKVPDLQSVSCHSTGREGHWQKNRLRNGDPGTAGTHLVCARCFTNITSLNRHFIYVLQTAFRKPSVPALKACFRNLNNPDLKLDCHFPAVGCYKSYTAPLSQGVVNGLAHIFKTLVHNGYLINMNFFFSCSY